MRFALKDPTHSVFIETILELFPDARFVLTHRDPAMTISSLCSLYAYTRALFSDDVDPLALGPELMNSYLPASLERALDIVGRLAPGRVAHVRHVDVRRDPIGTMAQRWILIADFPFRNPTVFATLYFGGILKHRWTWSGCACPSSSSTSCCSHRSRRIFPIPRRNDPKITRFRYFGTKTMWYLQYHLTWHWLCHSRMAVSF